MADQKNHTRMLNLLTSIIHPWFFDKKEYNTLFGGRMNKRPYFIRAEWDEQANVWVASSDDVPGLATEGETLEKLIQKLKVMIPELLEANGENVGLETSFEVFSRRFEIAHRAAV